MARANKEQLLDAYQRMLGIRLVELRLGRLFADGEVPGFIHLSVGQEAVAAAMGMVLRPDDTVASTHRGHGHALAKGIDMDDFFLELMAREEGICKGRGGSMHVANMSIGMLGANAIVGASIPIALGSALAHQVRKTDALAVAFFGDGAMAEGAARKPEPGRAVAAAAALPVREQRLGRVFAHPQAIRRAAGQAVGGLFDSARQGRRQRCAGGHGRGAGRRGRHPRRQGAARARVHHPRWRGHYEGDPQKYRDSDEISGLDEHDPVARFEAVLDSKGVSQAQRQKVRDAVQAQVDQAVERARKGRPPVWETARTDVYTCRGSLTWPNSDLPTPSTARWPSAWKRIPWSSCSARTSPRPAARSA